MSSMEQHQEPTLADVLAAVNTVAASVHDLATHTAAPFAKVDARLGQLDAGLASVRAEVVAVGAKVDQARADIAAVKVDTAYAEAHNADLQAAVRRHLDDPNAHGGHAA